MAGKTLLLFHLDEEFMGQYCDEAIVICDCQIVYQGSFVDAQKWFHLNVKKSAVDIDAQDQEDVDNFLVQLAEEPVEEVPLW